MTAWVLLGGAILSEVGATLGLRMAATQHRAWYAAVVAGYVVAFGLLFGALDHGVPLGVAYGTWAACGVALTALLSRVLFHEPLTPLMAAGVLLVAGGVVVLEAGAHH